MLRDDVENFIAHGGRPADLFDLLHRCIEDGTAEGLTCVRRLFEDDYHGFTFNIELKAPAGSTLLVWREAGLQALADGVRKVPTFKNLKLGVEILTFVAAGAELPAMYLPDEGTTRKIIETRAAVPQLADFSRSRLVEVILATDEDDLAIPMGTVIQGLALLSPSSQLEITVIKELFAALSSRWLAIGGLVLDEFEALLTSRPDDERSFQDFLTRHPQLLDPMAITIWPKPNILGSRFPDFVVRRADDTYVVIEIECPGKSIMTSGAGQPSSVQPTSEVTHAERQATDYRTYLLRRYEDARRHFPNFDDPDCLVVIGLESAR